MKLKKWFLALFLFFLSVTSFAQNLVLCWIFEMQGCEGVEPRQGASINIESPGNRGIGSTGAGVDRVERRTIITIPDYQIRKIQRFFGLGGTRINISYEAEDVGCTDNPTELPGIGDAFLEVSLTSCLRALESDLENFPRGIELNLVQCQDYFCHGHFEDRFEEYVRSNPHYPIRNVQKFLNCANPEVEI